jgi:hypothetical protein
VGGHEIVLFEVELRARDFLPNKKEQGTEDQKKKLNL